MCPKIMKKLERNKEADDYICHWSNNLQFEVDHSHEPRSVVDLEAKTCGCGRWQLYGIPCPHAICAIYRNRWYPEEYIRKWYLMDTYRLSYAPNIHPMSGPSDWPIDRDVDPIQPLIPKPQCGRPKKLRKRGIDETEAMKVLRSLERATVYFMEIEVKKAIMLKAAANLKIQTRRSIPRGLGNRSRSQPLWVII
jgi:hypothetical protein